MAILEMKVPSPGESISEVEIATWLVADGEWVDKDQTIAEVDSDKATLELPAEEAGIITLKAEEGDIVDVGGVVCHIDTSAKRPASAKKEEKKEAAPAKVEAVVAEAAPAATPVAAAAEVHSSPVAKKMMQEHGLSATQVNGTGSNGRITKKDVLSALAGGIQPPAQNGWGGTRDEERVRLSSLRRKVADRLVTVKNETAMLTTFNEVNMKPIMDVRKKYKEAFKEKYGVGLGFMSFFTKAVTEALGQFPSVNSYIDGAEAVNHNYADIGIAVSAPKGLMVPVIRNAETLALHEIEAEIKRLAIKARDGKLTIEEMTGGTFTITNGGVFGSMLSTPIINPPQSAILGMHNIVERPIAENGEVVIRPIMYVALSYDHRIIDGKESVSFLYAIKEMLEDPSKLLFGKKDPMEVLLGL
jgi:2-oxoglutarate dehydrogenase E2 component (dihydrolipoamide succinyltransferase)